MAIRRLPSAVVSYLRTDVTVTTSAQCVTELVLNSIDAGATAVAVRVNLQNFQIQVIDNGSGISLSDMDVVGTRYMTSKCNSLQDLQSNLSHFGFRGEALTSISDACGTLMITSRHQSSDETYCKVFTQGVPHKVGKSRQPRASCGTTITVSDFLYNRPVRRARVKPALDLEDIKVHLESIALINYKVSFSLRNNANNELLLQTKQANDIATVFGNLFGSENAKNLIPVEESFGQFKVKGYISSEAHFLKNLQFIFINQRLLLKTKLHKLVNSVMSRSAILKSNNVPNVPISKDINHGMFLAFSPPKRDKHAVFVLNVECPFSEYDITLDPKKTLIEFCDWDSLLSCFEQLLRKFIEQEAGAQIVKNICDSEPPKKLKTVVDEINQLAREEVLNKQGTLSPQKFINICRAVHSIPVRRDLVNYSPDPSEGMPSTSFCGLTSHEEDSTHPMNQIQNSVFTENPYPPASQISQGKPSDSLKPKHDPFSANMEVSLRLVESAGEGSKCFSRNQADKKKVMKGFITNTIHFEENFRKMSNGVAPGRSPNSKEPLEASPMNALDNIKEIRRKKLLKNLDKFSFKAACPKPVLHKAPISAGRSRPISHKSQETSKVVRDLQVCRSKSPSENVKESKAVQTTFSLSAPQSSKSITSQAATCNSSVNLISLKYVNERLATPRSPLQHDIPQSFPVSLMDDIRGEAEKGKASCSVISHIAHLEVQNSELKNPFCLNESFSGSLFREETSKILSVDDLYVAGEDRRSNDCLPLKASKSSWFKLKDDVCQKNINESPSIEQMFPDVPSQNNPSKHQLDGLERKSMENFPIGPKISSKQEPQETSVNLNISLSLSGALQDAELVDVGSERTQRKIVDYDSSPSLSQESSSSNDTSSSEVSSSQSNLKRRCNSQSEEILSKKCCLSCKTDLPYASSEVCEVEHSPCLNCPSAVTLAKGLQLNSMSLEENSKYCNEEAKISTQPSDENNISVEENWIRKVDGSGEPFYIHQESGMTTYRKPNEKKPGTFKMSERIMFLPKGMSPIFKDKFTNEPSTSPSRTCIKGGEDFSAIKWGVNEFADNISFWPLVDQLLSEADKFSENQCHKSQISDATSQELSQAAIKIHNAMFPYSFSKEIFHNLQVLGQLDNKFIVTLASIESNKEIILLFDQHAVHERIRVESLTNEYKVHDGTAIWKSSPVEPALPLSLSSIEVRILQSYRNKLEDLGFSFSSIDSNTINVLRVPTCLLLRENREVMGRGVSVLRQHLESLVREQVDSLLNTRGVGTVHPSIIRNVISSEACRGAVKFGHPLSVADCQAFLHNLSECNLPFQCAHGRPALMPIVDLSQLKPRLSPTRPNLQKLKTTQKSA